MADSSGLMEAVHNCTRVSNIVSLNDVWPVIDSFAGGSQSSGFVFVVSGGSCPLRIDSLICCNVAAASAVAC